MNSPSPKLWGTAALVAALVLTPVVDRLLGPGDTSSAQRTVPQDAGFSAGGTEGGVRLDFDGDGRADEAVIRNETGKLVWYARHASGRTFTEQFGVESDVPVPADYDGDGDTDLAVWRPDGGGAGTFFIQVGSGERSIQFGRPGDDPTVTADYDGDGIDDPAVHRPGFAFVRPSLHYLGSADGGARSTSFGLAGDRPVRGDFDGDGRADQTVARTDGARLVFFTRRSSDGRVDRVAWGRSSDRIAPPGDFDGDGRSDLMVIRDVDGRLVWWRFNPAGGVAIEWGRRGDQPVVADFDGDGSDDIAVWRPSTGQYLSLQSTAGERVGERWGRSGDVPIG